MQRKTIRIYVPHTWVDNVQTLLEFLNIECLKDDYDFVWDESTPDYIICTDQIYSKKKIFGKFKKLYKSSAINIFYASEAITPDFNIFDYAIGWDVNLQFGDRYCLLPPAHIYPGKKFVRNIENPITTFEQAKKELSAKTGFCSFLYSNWVAHPMRDQLFYGISKYKRVDSLGKHLNNVNKKGTGYVGHRSECIDIKRPYKFSIASENATFSGYTSEKILTSFDAHSIPIYWGDPDIEKYYNGLAFINAMKYGNIHELTEKIKEIDENDNLWCEMIMQPWQTPEQITLSKKRYKDYVDFYRYIFDIDIKRAKRAPSGTMPDIYSYTLFNGFMSLVKKYYRVVKHKIVMHKN